MSPSGRSPGQHRRARTVRVCTAVTIFFPDISSYQTGFQLNGIPAIMVKATEGTGYVSPDYRRVVRDAQARGLLQMAYHFLHRGNAVGQADFAFSVIGGDTPTMVDVETAGDGSAPTLGDVLTFVDRFRAHGGTVHLVYLPRWYWSDFLGGPGLGVLPARGLRVVSSSYTTYHDFGPGWQPYGGVAPDIWQFSETTQLNGFTVDMNAFRGSVEELRTLVTGEDLMRTKLIRDPKTGAVWLSNSLQRWFVPNPSMLKDVVTVGKFHFSGVLMNDVPEDVDNVAAFGAVIGFDPTNPTPHASLTAEQVDAIGKQVADAVVAQHQELSPADAPAIQKATADAVRQALAATNGAQPTS